MTFLMNTPGFTFWKMHASPKIKMMFKMTDIARTTKRSRSSDALFTISVSIRFSTLMKTMTGRRVVIHSMMSWTRLFA